MNLTEVTEKISGVFNVKTKLIKAIVRTPWS